MVAGAQEERPAVVAGAQEEHPAVVAGAQEERPAVVAGAQQEHPVVVAGQGMSSEALDSLSAVREGLQRASVSTADDPYAAQFAALGSMTNESENAEEDEDDCNVRVSSTPEGSATDDTSRNAHSQPNVPKEHCVKALVKLGDDVVHFRPGDGIIAIDTLNAQLLSARCAHCKQSGCLIIDPPQEERRGFFIIMEALTSMCRSKFTRHLKLWCSRCESRCLVRFYVAPDGSVWT